MVSRSSPLGLERGAEPVFDDRGLAEIAEVDGAAALRNGLGAGPGCGAVLEPDPG